MKFELCTDSVEGVILAEKLGFTSVELCSALSAGGLTPSYGLIKQCALHTNIEIHTMIRHREGGFEYSSDDLILMKLDIEAAKKAGATGVVFGILNAERNISDQNFELVQMAHELGLKATFHRAFDFVPDFRLAIEKVLSFGFDRLLTSGLKEKAEDGLIVISELQQKYGHLIQVIAGSGINKVNALRFSKKGINYVHFTARKPLVGADYTGMGLAYTTDVDKIKGIINLPFGHIN